MGKIKIENVPEVATISQLLGVDANNKWAKIPGSTYAKEADVLKKNGYPFRQGLNNSREKIVEESVSYFWISPLTTSISALTPLIFKAKGDIIDSLSGTSDDDYRMFEAHCFIRLLQGTTLNVKVVNEKRSYSRSIIIGGLKDQGSYMLTVLIAANGNKMESRGIINELAII